MARWTQRGTWVAISFAFASACSASGGGAGGSGTDRPATCSDGRRSASETGTDCGGPDCLPCPGGDGCLVGPDCESGLCGDFGTCVDIPNVDDSCTTDDDCIPFRCAGGKCGNCRSCDDLKDGTQTDLPTCIGSQALFDAVVSCACSATCKSDCSSFCTSHVLLDTDTDCALCLYHNCSDAKSACLDDALF